MLTVEGCAARRQRLWEALPSPCDLLVLSDATSLIYFAGYAPSPFEFRANESTAVLLLEPGRATLIADKNSRSYLDRTHVDEIIAPVWYDGQHSAPPRKAHTVSAAVDHLRSHSVSRVGVESATVPIALDAVLPEARLDLDPIVRPLRRTKHEDEIALLRRCLQASDAAMTASLERLEPGMTELQAFELVRNVAVETAGEPVWIYGDFASSTHGERRGGLPTPRVIEPGDLIILDFSVVITGYRGDVANTFVVGGGRASDRQRELCEACIEAMGAAVSHLKPGTLARDVDAAVRESFRSQKLDGFFTTHSGHGVGLGHPEPPYFVPDSSDTLVAGDVVTLEPGQYHPNVTSMRFEHDFLIRPDGCERLSNHRLAIQR